MALAGYPDWQRVQYAGGLQLFNKTEDMSGGINVGYFNVQAWANLLVTMVVGFNTSVYKVEFDWYTQEFGGNLIVRTNLVFNSSNGGTMRVPVLGPWVNITVSASPVTDTTPVSLAVYTTSNILSSCDVYDNSVPLLSDVSAYAANQQKTFLPSVAYSGPAILSHNPQGQFYSACTLYYLTYAVSPQWVQFFVLQSTGQTTPLNALVSIPAAPLRVIVGNTPTAQTIAMAITPINR